MRIIQTLWLPNHTKNALKNTCGWLSPEYHWISWALSFNQLRKFYGQIELYTNKAGKEVLIDKLKLPYSKVHLVFDDLTIPETSWVYYKVYTYSLQEESFIHVDGDVNIWNKFPKSFEKSPLIAQNQEFNFDFYSETLSHIRNQNIPLPSVFGNSLLNITYNAGIIGGNDITFFKEYSQIVLRYLESHHELLKDLPNSNCAMLLEQGIFSILVHQYKTEVACAFDIGFDDFHYPGLSNLYKPNDGRLNHFMNLTKRNRFHLKHLSSKLRQEYPEQYYAILRLCQEVGIELDFKIYGLDDFSPSQKSSAYFKEIMLKFEHKAFQKNSIDWQYYYAKDAFVYRQAEYLYSLSENAIKALKILKNKDFQLIDTSTESVTAQHVMIMDTFGLTEISIDLEDLEMILLDAISETEPQTFDNILAEMSLYFDETDYQENVQALSKLLIEKIEIFIFRGLIRLI